MKLIDHVIAERRELLELCHTLTSDEWEAPSLCAGWRVRDVLAHILGEEHNALDYLAAGGLHRGNAQHVEHRRNWPIDYLLRELENTLRPGLLTRLFARGALLDNWVHHEDIRRPLNYPRQQDPERLQIVLDLAYIFRFFSLRGLQLLATDLDWRRGRGIAVTGPADSLAMAMMGRPSAVTFLSGKGVGRLLQ